MTAADGGFDGGFAGAVVWEAAGTEPPLPAGGVVLACSLTWLSTCKPPSSWESAMRPGLRSLIQTLHTSANEQRAKYRTSRDAGIALC